ncbi:MAG TPA: hypothetical protein PKO06_12495 [Candidatus Ozemobacteraceae bacterium]|nr:hypothetical protein [Candidatus Ozemobacteraceae bacterium]
MSLLLSPLFLRHGVAALQDELARLADIAQGLATGDWPPGYDPNDAVLLQSLLPTLREATNAPLTIELLRSKPLQFFFHLFPDYLRRHDAALTSEDRCEIQRSLDEYQRLTGIRP